MGGILNDALRSMKSKEKVTVIASMTAVAALLVGIVVMIAYFSGATHVHKYDGKLEFSQGQFNFIAKCTDENCENPDLYIENVNATVFSTKAPTCLTYGEIVYAYEYEGCIVKCAMETDKSGHALGGVEMDLNKTYKYYEDIFQNRLNISTNIPCNSTGEGSFVCDVCHQQQSVNVVSENHKFYFEITKLPTAQNEGKAIYKCRNVNCNHDINNTSILLPKIEIGQNANLISEATATAPAYVSYTYILPDAYAYMNPKRITFSKLEYIP